MSKTPTMRIADIKIGERHRDNLGDVQALAESIKTTGLLHPVVVAKSGELVTGERRLWGSGLQPCPHQAG